MRRLGDFAVDDLFQRVLARAVGVERVHEMHAVVRGVVLAELFCRLWDGGRIGGYVDGGWWEGVGRT
jgi:hypothetical protein